MWKNVVERDRQQTIWRMRIACWIPNATNTHSDNVILTALPLQQWLHDRPAVLRFTYTECRVLRYSVHTRGDKMQWSLLLLCLLYLLAGI